MNTSDNIFPPNPKAQARVLALKHNKHRNNGPRVRLMTVWMSFCLSFVVCLLAVYGL